MNQSMGKGISNLRDIGPYEFVSLVENAEYVCTNSFHALAFSIILEKPVLHYHHKDLGVRTVDLLTLMGVNELDVDGAIVTKFLNYKRLETLIDNSKKFLSSNISSKGGSEFEYY
ncbi:polysaccharide pyruvyl transferase family protein [Clostridium estertheticum]|uniref:polysaccharide pyruvyl transferase family protein n=1 Tax=Clostridium estertheticum TaxID=238834 RepID=UPI0013EEBC27|nr:polysaccharide pyruvyl transferase family protein [Clostridium estertheticum]MBZ9609334.1 polysaccharide pyruvyl transferase family protein [Clostridium estertheticum]